MPLIPTFPALLAYEVAFNAAPNQPALPPAWTDVSALTAFPWATNRGRQYELDTVPAGTWNVPLDNRGGTLDPANTTSPYYPGVVPFRACRIRAMTGVNALSADQATAGERTGYFGAIPPDMGVNSGAGYTVTLATAADAYQGAQVYQVAVPSGATAPKDLLDVITVPIVAGTAYCAQMQTRILSTAQNLNVHVSVNWLNSSGGTISTTVGTNALLTGGATAWTQITASGSAPTGAMTATIRAVLATTTTSGANFQADALQFEQSPIPTPFQVPQTLGPNLLPRVIATGSSSMAATDTVAAWWYVASTAVANALYQAVNLAPAPTGHTTALQWLSFPGTIPSTVLYVGNWLQAGSVGPQPDCVQVTAGMSYTASYYTMRGPSADATVKITPSIYWFAASGALLSTTAGTPVTVPVSPTWSARATVTGTAPTGAAWGRIGESITTPATTTDTNNLYHAAYQFEQAPAATAWSDPGPTYYIYTGLVERWPQTWRMSGTYGLVNVIGVDALAALAQYTLLAPFLNEVLALAPTYLYTLSDPAGSSTVSDSAGRCPAGVVSNSPYGSGTVQFGSAITSTTAGQGFTGAAGPVATFANTPSSAAQTALTYIALSPQVTTPNYGLTSGIGGASTSFTRIIAFRVSALPAAPMYLWSATMPTYVSPQPCQISVWIDTAGHVNLTLTGSGTYTQTYAAQSYADGNWHFATLGTDNVSGGAVFSLDGVATSVTGGPSLSPLGLTRDSIGAFAQDGGATYNGGAAADIALACQVPVKLTAAQITNLYQSWRSASSGESTGSRYQRVLTWVGYPGATAIDTGVTQQMGPATDLTGATALDSLNAVALTENGNSYVSSSGVLTFKQRSARYNQATPSFVFGEQQALGEWPYESLASDYDPSHLFNNVQVSQYSSGQTATAIDRVSQASYFPRIIQRTINVLNYSEAADAASYLLQQYRNPRTRVASITLHPSAQPGLFLTCLRLEIGTRIRVMRRPPGVPVQQIDCFVESVAWSLDPNTGEAFVTLQCSPADVASYWVLAAMHTTLNAQATAGATSLTINALPDAATNVLASSMPQNQQLTLEPGTPRAETVTVVPPLPTTTLGYATAVLTVTPALAFQHAAGTTVCEPLPTGVTDPAAYDAQSVLGALGTTLAATITAGAGTVTVNALPDSQHNAFASDIPQGQVLWLSPGTVNFEAVTVAAAGVPVSFPGYTQIVLTLTAGTTKPHTAGDTVCEPLPAGLTSPAAVGATTRIAY